MTAIRTRQPADPSRSDDASTSGVSRRALLAGGLAGAGVMLAGRTAGAWLRGQAAQVTAMVLEVPRLFDGTKMAVTDGARIVVRNGSIVAAGRAADVAAPAGAT